MKIGYIRVSTLEQNTVRQEIVMEELGVEKVYIDKVSGKNADRPALKEMMSFVREGDVVIVESFSRFSRSAKDLLNLVDELDKKKVEFISKKENVDTTTPQGKFMLTVFAAVSELERDQILQRQAEGIAAAKAAGKYKGRKPIAVDEEKFIDLYRRWKADEITTTYMKKQLGLSHTTFYRKVREYEIKHGIIQE